VLTIILIPHYLNDFKILTQKANLIEKSKIKINLAKLSKYMNFGVLGFGEQSNANGFMYIVFRSVTFCYKWKPLSNDNMTVLKLW